MSRSSLPRSRVHGIAWFCGLYLASIVTVVLVGAACRLALRLALAG